MQGGEQDDDAAAAGGGFALMHVVTPGEVITTDTTVLRGHGTYSGPQNELIASVAGVVERVNKLITVRPLRSRYVGEIGDVVIGRVLEVLPKKWRLDIHARQDGILMLSAINLPGGVQRRRTVSDEMNMRSFFKEGDLVSCEVQQFYGDGSMALHTRSLKYGLLRDGVFVAVTPSLVKRSKTHFQLLECGVHVLLGNNGYIWVSPPLPEVATGADEEAEQQVARVPVTPGLRLAIARVANAIRVLNRLFVAIYSDTIMDVYRECEATGVAPRDMLRPDVMWAVSGPARARVAQTVSY